MKARTFLLLVLLALAGGMALGVAVQPRTAVQP